jgi:hypothetical protein
VVIFSAIIGFILDQQDGEPAPGDSSRRDPIRPSPASPIAPRGPLAGSPGEYRQARDHLERALALFHKKRAIAAQV